MTAAFPQGTVHTASPDVKAAISADPGVLALWQGLTPLGRNEFLCWIEDAKQEQTRARRIRRTVEEMQEGKRRPCCWPGCVHRTDKKPSPSQQAIMIDRKKR